MISHPRGLRCAGAATPRTSPIGCCKRLRWRAAVPADVGQHTWGAASGCQRRLPCIARAKGIRSNEPMQIGGYTPSDYITFSDKPEHACVHTAEALVAAPLEACFALWDDWERLVEFIDVIGQIGLDENRPDMALFQCYYRWSKLPVMEIAFLLHKSVTEPGRRIEFSSEWGMPIKGRVELSEAEDAPGSTRVRLVFTHPMPNLLLELSIGTLAIETHMAQILGENMEELKKLAEAEAGVAPGSSSGGGGGGGGGGERPPGALRQAAAEARRAAGAGAGTWGGGEAAEGKPPRRSRGATQSKAAAAAGSAAAAAAPKQRRGASRHTASSSEAAPADAGAAGAAPPPPVPEAAAAAAAAAPKRGRPSRRSTAANNGSGAAGAGAGAGADADAAPAAGKRGRPRTSQTRG